MITILGHIIPCIFYGLLISLFLTFLFKALVGILCSSSSLSFPKWLYVGVLFLFYMFQSVLFLGANYAKEYVDSFSMFFIESYQTVEYHFSGDMSLSADDIDQLKRELEREYPSLQQFVDQMDFSTISNDKRDIQLQVSDSLEGALSSYKWRRVMWIAIVTVLSVILFVMTDSSPRPYGRSGRSHRRDSSSYHSRSRRTRISRR